MSTDRPGSSPNEQRNAVIAYESAARAPVRRVDLLTILAIVGIVAFALRSPARWEVDSFIVGQGVRELIRWFATGGEGPIAPLGSYPLFQYLTGLLSAALAAVGVPVTMNEIWSFTSRASFVALPLLTYRTILARGGSSATATVAALVMIAGPFVAYATSTFNELPAALLTAAFVAALLCRRGIILVSILFWLVGITKEFAPLLLAIFWVYEIWNCRGELSRREVRLQLSALLLITGLTIATNAAFNMLRYGTARNTEYLDDPRMVESIALRGGYVAALWLAPNGGVVPSWPMLPMFVAAGAIAATFFARRAELGNVARDDAPTDHPLRSLRFLDRAAPALAVILVLGILTVGLSRWIAPFGWYCWGPRLMLPWLPAALIVLVCGYMQAFDRAAGIITATALRRIGLGLFAAIVSLPPAMFLTDTEVVHDFFNNAERRLTPQYDSADPQRIHHVALAIAWRERPWLMIRPLWQSRADPRVAIAPIILCVSIVLLVSRVGRSPPRPV